MFTDDKPGVGPARLSRHGRADAVAPAENSDEETRTGALEGEMTPHPYRSFTKAVVSPTLATTMPIATW